MKRCENLTEEDILTDLLLAEKALVKIYATALTEMSENKLRTLMKKYVGEVSDDQNQIFCQMQKRGYYEVAPAPKQKIDSAKEKFASFCN